MCTPPIPPILMYIFINICFLCNDTVPPLNIIWLLMLVNIPASYQLADIFKNKSTNNILIKFFLLESLSSKTLELTIFNWIQLSQYLSEVCLLRIKHKPDPNPDFKLRDRDGLGKRTTKLTLLTSFQALSQLPACSLIVEDISYIWAGLVTAEEAPSGFRLFLYCLHSARPTGHN